ncbi:MAG: LPS export ABC transporter permease LptF [Gammaproteobacteria bacterium]|nr:LPS export ABC transporter permease LptF [Gammaproteobacteria bacterium]
MIAGRWLGREILLATALITAVLLLVTLGARLSGYLAEAADGRLSASAVLAVIGLRIPGFLVLLLPLSFHLGLLLALARLQGSSELVILRAAGLGPLWLARRALVPALGSGLLVALLALGVAPAANQRIEALLSQEQGMAALGRLVPGRFHPLGEGERVARATGVDRRTGVLSGVLLVEQLEAGQRLLTAERGRLLIEAGTGARILRLESGHRHDLMPGDRVRRMQFEVLEQRLDPGRAGAGPTGQEARSTRALIGDPDPRARAELHWRLALPLLPPVLALVVLALTATGRKAAGAMRPALVLAAFLGLFALLMTGRSAVADGTVAGRRGHLAGPRC